MVCVKVIVPFLADEDVSIGAVDVPIVVALDECCVEEGRSGDDVGVEIVGESGCETSVDGVEEGEL